MRWTCIDCTRQQKLTRASKTCGTCTRTLPLAEFHKSKTSIDKRGSQCRDCRAQYHRERMGAGNNWFSKTLESQNFCCALCGTSDPGGRGRFHIDHHRCCGNKSCCEKCKRGILCSQCNTKLGVIENTDWLNAAISYLISHGNTDILSVIKARL
jgi:Recombination endonuclease VII